MHLLPLITALIACLTTPSEAQQYAGDVIPNSLPAVPGSEVTYFRVQDASGKNKNLTLINYYSHGTSDGRLVEANIQRAVVIIHGLNRDPGTYMSNMLSALSQVTSDPNVNQDTVAIMAPYFANGDDKNTGYPWTDGLAAGKGSTSNALVWKGSQWSAGGNNQYPYTSKTTSSYTVLDQIIQYFDNAKLFPKMNQIVIAGHSLGAQTVQRYAAIGAQLNTRSPVSYWVANPNSYAWQSTSRPLPTSSCPSYDAYREGYSNFTDYPMTYGTSLVAAGRGAIQSNYNGKAINYARGTQDLGDDSSSCAPFTTGNDRNERFFNFIKAFPVSCPDPKGRNCDTVDFVNSGHDGGAMMAAPAGQARLFLDNFYGDGNRSYDFGYPRQQAGDDPYPNPALNTTAASVNNNTYAGNMTYWGCWSDQNPPSLNNLTYQSDANTIELCTQTCADGGNTIAGLESGSQCFCGTSLGYLAQEVIESSCQMPCSGNSTENCGGNNRLSIFSNGRPQVNSAPGTPETVGDYYYVSCYTEATNGRALAAQSTSSNSMTLEYCANFCAGYQYFGTEYASECYCGNNFSPGAVRTSDNDCSMLCANATSEFCGGPNRLTVYQNPSFVAPSSTSSSAATPSATGLACPAANNTVAASGGKNFTIDCGTDYQAGDLTNVPAASFQFCLDACAQNDQCVAVAYTSVCYLKSSVGPAISNGAVSGARLVGSSASSSTTSSAPATTSSTTSATSLIVPSTSSASSTDSSSAASSSSGSSTSSSSATTSTSASPSSTPVTCPASNGTTVVSNGISFAIECGIDHAGGDMSSQAVGSFQECITACAATTGCVDVSYLGAACYLKSSVGMPVYNDVWGARVVSSSTSSSTTSGSASSSSSLSSSTALTTSSSASSSPPTSSASGSQSSSSETASSSATTISSSATTASSTPVSCPGSNTTTTMSNGQSFLIECGIDHAGGDMKALYDMSFQNCIDACATTLGCVDLSYLGNACYLKSQVGAPMYNGVFGARLLSSVPSSSSSSVSTDGSTTATSASSTSASATSLSTDSSTTTSAESSTSTGAVSTDSTTTASSGSSTSTSATSSASSSAAPLPSGFAALGCFVDSSDRLLSYSNGSSNTQTPEQCALNCRSLGYKYSGVEYASECYCSNTTPPSSAAAPSSDCNMACKGDPTQKCGAGNRLNVVVDNTWQQTFFARQSYDSWNLMACYTDSVSSRTLPETISLDAFGGASNATVAHCLDACAARGYEYCGAEYYAECYGSSASPTGGVAPGADPLSAGCNFPCKGNMTEACGGSNRILVYVNNGTAA